MRISTDENGHMTFRLGPKELKHERMWIRARIPTCLPNFEKHCIVELIMAHMHKKCPHPSPYHPNSPPSEYDLFDQWCCDRLELDREQFLAELKKLARRMGIKHWRLRR